MTWKWANREFDGAPHLLTVEAKFPSHDVVGNRAFARDFRWGFGGLFAIDSVFEFLDARFEELEVGYGNDRGEGLAVAFEKHGIAVLDVLDGFGEVFVRTLDRSLRHISNSFPSTIAGERAP